MPEHKPGALPGPIAAVKAKLLKQPKGDRAFVEILLGLREHGSELPGVACEPALGHRTVSVAVVLNQVRRLKAPLPMAPLQLPAHLRLVHEPQADCGRYDQLRSLRLFGMGTA